MITVTITVAALAATSILGYFIYRYKNEAETYKVKFQSTKEFADKAGSRILKLEATNTDLSNHIILMRGKMDILESKQGAKVTNTNVGNSPVEAVVGQEVIAKAKPRRRYKNKNKAKDTNTI